MKKLKYGNIKHSGNTKYAAPFQHINVACMECDSGKHRGIKSRADKGFKIHGKKSFELLTDKALMEYTLECLECGCVFTVYLDMEEEQNV